jgi:hypothetical protein
MYSFRSINDPKSPRFYSRDRHPKSLSLNEIGTEEASGTSFASGLAVSPRRGNSAYAGFAHRMTSTSGAGLTQLLFGTALSRHEFIKLFFEGEH